MSCVRGLSVAHDCHQDRRAPLGFSGFSHAMLSLNACATETQGASKVGSHPVRSLNGEGRRLAIFLQDLAGGGAERVMLQLAGGLADRGVHVDLVLVRATGAYLPDVPRNVNLVTLDTNRTIRSIPALTAYLRRDRPEVIVSALVHVNLAAVLAARMARSGVRVVFTEHNQISQNAQAATSPLIQLAHRAVPYLYRLADNIVAVSQGVAEDLSRYSGLPSSRFTVIHNPIVTPKLHEMASAAGDETPWISSAGDAPIILGAGRLTQQKDFPTLIRAFAKIVRHREARLVILGEGPERANLEALVAGLGLNDKVDLPGFVDNPYAIMRRASLFVLSSSWEGLPTVLVEAMACGTPVVATDCISGPREILEGGRFGPLVPVGDVTALADAVVSTMDAPPERSSLEQRASDFTLEPAVDQYMSVLFRE